MVGLLWKANVLEQNIKMDVRFSTVSICCFTVKFIFFVSLFV